MAPRAVAYIYRRIRIVSSHAWRKIGSSLKNQQREGGSSRFML